MKLTCKMVDIASQLPTMTGCLSSCVHGNMSIHSSADVNNRDYSFSFCEDAWSSSFLLCSHMRWEHSRLCQCPTLDTAMCSTWLVTAKVCSRSRNLEQSAVTISSHLYLFCPVLLESRSRVRTLHQSSQSLISLPRAANMQRATISVMRRYQLRNALSGSWPCRARAQCNTSVYSELARPMSCEEQAADFHDTANMIARSVIETLDDAVVHGWACHKRVEFEWWKGKR